MISYKVKLEFKSLEDKTMLKKTLDAHKLAYNAASRIIFGMDKKLPKILHQRFYADFRKDHPYIKADLVMAAMADCFGAYKSVYKKHGKINKTIEKKRLSMALNKNLCSYKNSDKTELALTVLGEKRIQVKFTPYAKLSEMMNLYPSRWPKIFLRGEDIYLMVVFDNPKLSTNFTKAIGVDMGMRRLVSTSDGSIYQDKLYLKHKRKLRFLRRELHRCIGTKKSKSAKRHFAKLKGKETRLSINYCHKISKEILKTDASHIILEDLSGVKGKKSEKRNRYKSLNRISQVPFYLLRQQLTYKAGLRGKAVHVINPAFTSQIDYRTGKKDGKRQGCRYYEKDGVVLDADLNAANNILLRSKLPDSCKHPCSALDGQVSIIRPIV